MREENVIDCQVKNLVSPILGICIIDAFRHVNTSIILNYETILQN